MYIVDMVSRSKDDSDLTSEVPSSFNSRGWYATTDKLVITSTDSLIPCDVVM